MYHVEGGMSQVEVRGWENKVSSQLCSESGQAVATCVDVTVFVRGGPSWVAY